MGECDLRVRLRKIVTRDKRYDAEAYRFVSEALDYTIRALGRQTHAQEAKRHVTAKELLNGIREYGLKKFGPMTRTVFAHWGIHSCEDFGEIVFNLVDEGLLRTRDSDSKDDFKNEYDFHDAFDVPFEA